MNERIKQFIGQATTEEHDGFRYLDKAKFAELIVRECANIVQDSPWQLPQGYKSVDQAKLVKKYFGVD